MGGSNTEKENESRDQTILLEGKVNSGGRRGSTSGGQSRPPAHEAARPPSTLNKRDATMVRTLF